MKYWWHLDVIHVRPFKQASRRAWPRIRHSFGTYLQGQNHLPCCMSLGASSRCKLWETPCLVTVAWFPRDGAWCRLSAQLHGHPFKTLTRIETTKRLMAHATSFECRCLSSDNPGLSSMASLKSATYPLDDGSTSRSCVGSRYVGRICRLLERTRTSCS